MVFTTEFGTAVDPRNILRTVEIAAKNAVLHLLAHWPWEQAWLTLWRSTIGYNPPAPLTT